MATLEQHLIDVDGAVLEVFLGGTGEPIICTSHPFNASAPEKLAFRSALGRLVAVTPRGLGRSSAGRGPGEYTFRQQVADFFSKLAEMQDVERFEPQEFVAQGDVVVALGHYKWRVKSTSRSFESDWAHVFTIRNGKVVKFHEYYDTNAGVEAYRSASAARS